MFGRANLRRRLWVLLPSLCGFVQSNGDFSYSREEWRNKMELFAFRRDVVRKAEERARRLSSSSPSSGFALKSKKRKNSPLLFDGSSSSVSSLGEMLMEKAVPWKGGDRTASPKSKRRQGIPNEEEEHSRELEDQGDDDDGNGDDDDGGAKDDDDYYMDPDYMFGFGGYSMKYGTCQKIQRFSSNAVANGEYSSLISDDIVVIRFCPQRRCSESVQYGCNAGYGEYALELKEYLRIMVMYEQDKQNNLCGFCKACSGGYADDYTGYYPDGNNRRKMEDAGDDAQGDDAQGDDGGGDDGAGGDDAAAGDDAAVNDQDDAAYDDAAAADDGGQGDDGYQYDDCTIYSDLCYNYAYWCNNGDDDDDDDGLSSMDYLDYFYCVQIEGEDAYGMVNYWISPWCDPYSDAIKMGIFYDPFCSQYAGNDLNVNDFTGIPFQSDIFEDYYSSTCRSCDSNTYPPYYNSNNNMCNRIYKKSARCNTFLAYDLDDEYYDADEENINCAYIESIRYGTYDATGQIYVSSSQYNKSQPEVVTWSQKVGLFLTALIMASLSLYSCYLHHQITNVLLRSIAHGHLLPGDKGSTKSRSSRSRKSSRSSSSKRQQTDETDSDWDHSARHNLT